MINIPNRVSQPLTRDTVHSMNSRVTGALDKNTVTDLNRPAAQTASTVGSRQASQAAAQPVRQSQPARQPQQIQPAYSSRSGPQTVPAPAAAAPARKMPPLQKPLRKGQKIALAAPGAVLSGVEIRFGWSEKQSQCDMDASAFPLRANGLVPGDDWFVFYSQDRSPDGSICFSHDASGVDREVISVDLRRLSPEITKIAFVLSIDRAFEQKLDFSMMTDVYVRVLDSTARCELASYRLEEYYPGVTSMTLGELYIHNGQWKFNPVGNGVRQDLAGQCAIYGVQIG